MKDVIVGARRPILSCRHPYITLLLLILCSLIFYSHVIKFNKTSSSSLFDDVDLDAPTLSVATTDEYTPISSATTYPIRDEADYIIQKSYTETYARIMYHCQDDNVIEKDCIALIVENMEHEKQETTNNSTTTAHTYPWWFRTLLRDIPTNGAYGFWHHFSTNATYPSIKFCAIGKNGSTEWRKVFKASHKSLFICRYD